MPSKGRKAVKPDYVGLSLTTTTNLPGGQRVREVLTTDLLYLHCNRFQSGSRMTDREMAWVIDCLLWINWHAGKTGSNAQAEGMKLHTERPLMANA